ncbi:MAG: hypothetical protein AB2747_21775, partial [Candidatus Thiodiazotropha taylori]
GIPQHVIQRGNNREPCFFSEQDYFRYLDDLKGNQDRHHLKEENRLPASICFCWNKIKTAFD